MYVLVFKGGYTQRVKILQSCHLFRFQKFQNHSFQQRCSGDNCRFIQIELWIVQRHTAFRISTSYFYMAGGKSLCKECKILSRHSWTVMYNLFVAKQLLCTAFHYGKQLIVIHERWIFRGNSQFKRDIESV